MNGYKVALSALIVIGTAVLVGNAGAQVAGRNDYYDDSGMANPPVPGLNPFNNSAPTPPGLLQQPQPPGSITPLPNNPANIVGQTDPGVSAPMGVTNSNPSFEKPPINTGMPSGENPAAINESPGAGGSPSSVNSTPSNPAMGTGGVSGTGNNATGIGSSSSGMQNTGHGAGGIGIGDR